MLKEAMRSILAPLRNSSETAFDVSLKGGKDWRCFPKLVSYCFDISEAKNMSSIRHGSGRYHPCMRCGISFEILVQNRKSPSRVLSATTETRSKGEKLIVFAGLMR